MYSVAWSAATDPVLTSTNLAWTFFCPTNAAHQKPMRFVQEPHGKWQAVCCGDLLTGMGKRIKVVADLLNIRIRGWVFTSLETQQVRERCLGSLDLRGHDCFLAHKGMDEPVE